MADTLCENVTGDATGTAKKVRGPCTVLLEGTIAAALVTIKVGRVGQTRQTVAVFSADDDNPDLWDNGRGRARTIDIPGEFDISADVSGNGSGSQSVTVSVIN